MEKIQIRSKKLNAALFQFVFPFSTKPDSQKAFKHQLGEDGYRPFRLSDMDQQDLYYGEKYRVSHRTMERYYLPFTANVLFPHEEDAESFQRYSKSLDLHCLLKTKFVNIPFRILSADVILCPFDLGFITVRTEMTDSKVDFTEALEFANRFRVLQDIDEQDDMTFVVHEDKEYEEVEEFIFKIVAASILPFLDTSQMEGAYFETMPFFVDERMYVQSFYGFEEGEELHKEDLYRAARIDGMTEKGDPYLSASSPDYIEWYCRDHTYNRWAPNTFYVTDENSFSCLTNLPKERAVGMANQMYGEYYYGLLLNLFHKIVLLKLSNRYSQVRVEKNKEEIEDLIGSITMFSAKYFFLELVTQSQGREIFIRLRDRFGNSELYQDVKETLNDLFQYMEEFSTRRSNYLLMILTVYTVISGIYGMNQVIEDLKGKIDWSKLLEYSVFEYIALVVAFSGIIVSFGLSINVIYKWTRDKWRRG